MTDSLREYPEYRDSGLQWLGRIPAHWYIVRTKRLFRLCTDKSPSQHSMELLSIYTHIGVRPRKELEERGNKASTTDGYWIVKKGDLIVNKLLAWMGAIGISHYEGVTSPAYDILRPRCSLNSDFYHFLFRTGEYLQQFKSRSRGIMDMRLRLYFDQLGQIPAVLPPREEQDAIVRYLDGISRLTNRFIRNRRQLIAVLNERKQAIINRVVTKGLDSKAKMKPSGNAWLGEIPEHWSVQRLRSLAELRVSNVDKKSNPDELPVRLCNYTDVYKNEEITANMGFMKATATTDEICAFRLCVGDVIVTKDSEDWQDIGVPSLVESSADDIVCGYHLAILRPMIGKIYGAFLFYALQSLSARTQLSVSAKGVTRYGLSHGAIKDLVLCVPPDEEQKGIVEHINRETQVLRDGVRRAQKEIDLIREYCKRLITDVVTGKVDVRNLAASTGSLDEKELPDELEPLEDEAALVNDDQLAEEVAHADD